MSARFRANARASMAGSKRSSSSDSNNSNMGRRKFVPSNRPAPVNQSNDLRSARMVVMDAKRRMENYNGARSSSSGSSSSNDDHNERPRFIANLRRPVSNSQSRNITSAFRSRARMQQVSQSKAVFNSANALDDTTIKHLIDLDDYPEQVSNYLLEYMIEKNAYRSLKAQVRIPHEYHKKVFMIALMAKDDDMAMKYVDKYFQNQSSGTKNLVMNIASDKIKSLLTSKSFMRRMDDDYETPQRKPTGGMQINEKLQPSASREPWYIRSSTKFSQLGVINGPAEAARSSSQGAPNFMLRNRSSVRRVQ